MWIIKTSRIFNYKSIFHCYSPQTFNFINIAFSPDLNATNVTCTSRFFWERKIIYRLNINWILFKGVSFCHSHSISFSFFFYRKQKTIKRVKMLRLFIGFNFFKLFSLSLFHISIFSHSNHAKMYLGLWCVSQLFVYFLIFKIYFTL